VCMYVRRAIAISNAETKVLETVILQYVNDVKNCDMYQFGFMKSRLDCVLVLLSGQLILI